MIRVLNLKGLEQNSFVAIKKRKLIIKTFRLDFLLTPVKTVENINETMKWLKIITSDNQEKHN